MILKKKVIYSKNKYYHSFSYQSNQFFFDSGNVIDKQLNDVAAILDDGRFKCYE